MSRPLEDIRVLDLGQIYQGPYCGMILSYLGADVVKVEPPGGDNVRFRSDDGNSPEVQFLNPNKRSLELDLKSDDGKDILFELVSETDVLIENFAPGKMENLGVGYETLSSVNPQLIYGHASGYGDDGPYTNRPAMDLTMQAIGGVMHTTGFPESPPVKTGIGVADFLGGIHLATGILGALYERERTNEGKYVDVGMMDCLYPTLASPVAAMLTRDDVPPRTGNRHSGMAIAPYNVYTVEDGYIAIICITERQWHSMVGLMDKPELLDDDRFENKVTRARHMDVVDGHINDWLEGFTKDEAVETLLATDIPCAPVKSVEELVEDPQLLARKMIHNLADKGDNSESIPVPGMPIKYRGEETIEPKPAPELGEHGREVLREICGYSDQEIANFIEDGTIGTNPNTP